MILQSPECRFGLTLIDLRVVIAIIAVLFSLLLPAVQANRRVRCADRGSDGLPGFHFNGFAMLREHGGGVIIIEGPASSSQFCHTML